MFFFFFSVRVCDKWNSLRSKIVRTSKSSRPATGDIWVTARPKQQKSQPEMKCSERDETERDIPLMYLLDLLESPQKIQDVDKALIWPVLYWFSKRSVTKAKKHGMKTKKFYGSAGPGQNWWITYEAVTVPDPKILKASRALGPCL